jgi:hypothetical protein
MRKKIFLSLVSILIFFLIITVYILYARYNDSLQLKNFLVNQRYEWINFYERSWSSIKTNDKNSFLDIFYVPLINISWDTLNIKISEYNEVNENMDFSFIWLDSVNAMTWWFVHFYTKELFFGYNEYRYPYSTYPFLTLKEDKTVMVDLKKNKKLYNWSLWWPFNYLYSINWNIIGLYVVFYHPINRYLLFEILNSN